MKRAFQILVFCFLVFTLSACSFMKQDKPKVEEEKEIVYHKVSFFDDSGVLIKENSVIHETSLIFDGNTPSKSSTAGVDFEFIGWDYTGDKLVDELPSSVTSPMQLKAVFDYKIDGQSVDFHRGSINQPTYTIESKTDMYVIDFSKLSGKQMLNTTVNIPQQLNRLVVIGNRDKDRSQFFEHITFNIMSRTTNIDLVFSDFAFSANSFNSGVVNSSNIELTIDFIGGQNEIYGSKGLDGQNGFYAISSTKLTIEGLAASLYGGEGGDGIAVTSNEHGKKGGDGGFAINATELTLNASSLMLRSGNGGKGSNGSSGNDAKDHTENAGNGFNGGAGGSGGTVINATTIVNNTPNLTLVVGSGGNGGAGGTGGSGAKGPDGIMVLKREVTESNQAQNGSNGGQGGNGGTGGEPGMFMNGNISGLTNIVKTAGIRGNGGAGGNGGIGGNGGNGAPDKGTYFIEKPYNLNGANGGAGGAGGSGGSGYVGGTKGLGAEGGAAGMGTSKTFGVFGNYKDQGSNGNPGAKGIDGYDGNSQG